MFIDQRQGDRWIGELNVVYVTIANSVGNFWKPPFHHRAVLSFLQRDHKLSVIEIDQGTRPWHPLSTLGPDGLRVQRFQGKSGNWPQVGRRLSRVDPP